MKNDTRSNVTIADPMNRENMDMTPSDVKKEPANGSTALSPAEIPAKGWWQVLLRTKREIDTDHISLISAGISFYALMALFPALAAAVSIYGLFADPTDVSEHVRTLSGSVPKELLDMVAEQMRSLAAGRDAALGLSLIVGVLLSIWGTAKGFRKLMMGLNIAYDENEKRGFIRKYLDSLVMTVITLAVVAITLYLMLGIPALVDYNSSHIVLITAVQVVRWVLLALIAMSSLAVLYRYGPYRENPKWRWVSVGSVAATVFWIAGSALFSWYVSGTSKYADTYGSVGGIIVVLMWLYLTIFVTLLGAELNAELERQTARDSTTGPAQPMGSRGAEVADEVASSPRIS